MLYLIASIQYANNLAITALMYWIFLKIFEIYKIWNQ